LLDFIGVSKTMETFMETDEKILVEMELTLLIETTHKLEKELEQVLSSQ